jgi:hypothetical protein
VAILWTWMLHIAALSGVELSLPLDWRRQAAGAHAGQATAEDADGAAHGEKVV